MEFLKLTDHRPWPIQPAPWSYYQEWNDALFLHFRLPADALLSSIPAALTLDHYEGDAWVSIVLFDMQKIRPRGLPSIPFLSDFHEVNIRTYVRHNGRQGVYFLRIDAQKWLSAKLAQLLSILPYRKSTLSRHRPANGPSSYAVTMDDHAWTVAYEPGPSPIEITALDLWLTERYCLFQADDERMWTYHIHHTPWPLQRVRIDACTLNMSLASVELNKNSIALSHYSPGVKLVSWEKVLS